MDDRATVRRYREGEANAVWRVHDAALRDSAMDFSPEYNRYLRHIGSEFLDPGGEFLVGTVGDSGDRRPVAIGGFQPVSYLVASGSNDYPREADPVDATARIRSVAVLPAFQSRGLGTELMSELEARAAESEFDRVVLKTTESLAGAQLFYESLGYDAGAERDEAGTESETDYLWYWKEV